GYAKERLSALIGIAEVEGKNLNSLTERIYALGMVCQSAYSVPAVEQEPRGVFSRVAERPSDDNSPAVTIVGLDLSLHRVALHRASLLRDLCVAIFVCVLRTPLWLGVSPTRANEFDE